MALNHEFNLANHESNFKLHLETNYIESSSSKHINEQRIYALTPSK